MSVDEFKRFHAAAQVAAPVEITQRRALEIEAQAKQLQKAANTCGPWVDWLWRAVEPGEMRFIMDSPGRSDIDALYRLQEFKGGKNAKI